MIRVSFPRAALSSLVVLAVLAFSVIPAASMSIRYNVIDIGHFSGLINDMNESGQMVGHKDVDGENRGVMIDPSGDVTVMPTFGGPTSIAHAINDSGIVAGQADMASGTAFHALWEPGKSITNIGWQQYRYGFAEGINDNGRMVGCAAVPGSVLHAFITGTSGTITDIGTLGGPFSIARDINNLNQVTGDSETVNGERHAFFWEEGGSMLDIGTLGGRESNGRSINNSGQVVGLTYLANNVQRAFLWDAQGGMIDLATPGGTSSYAEDINDSEQVVGNYSNSGSLRGFLWDRNMGCIDLTSAIDPSLNWRIQSASAINNQGWIGGRAYSYNDHMYHAYILQPVPEPSALIVLLCGLPMLVLQHKGKRKQDSTL